MPLSLYLHFPFCTVRCSYCDFNTYAGLESLIEPYLAALAEEVRQVARARPAGFEARVHTVFFGGGTPSLAPPASLRQVLDTIASEFELLPGAEITLEANPGTVSADSLAGFRALGVNRLSLGVQSAQPDELRLLDRHHTMAEAAEAVRWARWAGFDNLNLDLIYGLPGQSLAAWRGTLERILSLNPDHLSAYALSLEFGTPLRARVQRGLVPSPDPDRAAEMYELADRMLRREGFAQYEISNWARLLPDERPTVEIPARASRHNLTYWRNEPYLGFGAGAHGWAQAWRYSNVRSPQAYIHRIRHARQTAFPFSPAVVDGTRVDAPSERAETLLLGFRLTRAGVEEAAYRARFGARMDDHFGGVLQDLARQGLIERAPERARLTPSARLVANRVFEAFV